MSASQPSLFNLQEFTDAGGLLSGGRLYTYVAGTTTQKTAYTDSAGSVAQTYTSDGVGGLYIALNSRGELPSPLYLTTGSYDLCLKRSDGTTVWTRRAEPSSDVGNPFTTFLANLASSIGTTLVGFLQAGTGAVLRTLYLKLLDFPITPQDFGAVADGTTDCTAAILAANTYATSKNKEVFFPVGTYVFTPSALTSISTKWRGESKYNTIINVSNTFAGEAFRVLHQGALRNMAIQKPGLTKTAGSIGVRVSAASTGDQCVNPLLHDLYVRGFDKGIDLQNVYLLHADNVQVESNNYGIYCVPDSTGGLGFITTHTWFNCDIGHNGVNVYYNTPNYSNTVAFIGGNISDATGTYQSYFNKVRVLTFGGAFYLENSPTIRSVMLADVDYVSLDGVYMNNTGGIQVASGSQVRIEVKRLWATTATDVLTGADGTQMLSIHNSNLPSSGNSALTAWKTLAVENTNYNNQFIACISRGQSFGFKDTFQSGGGTVAMDMVNGDEQRITVTDAVAFSVGAPANAVSGQTLDLTIQNSAGAPMGAITWNAVFKLAGWVNPATGNNRTARFRYDGSVWHLSALTASDIPN